MSRRCWVKRKLAFLFVRETGGPGALPDKLRTEFAGPVIANDGFDVASGAELVAHGTADAVGFGRQLISNPHLVRRFRMARH
ncbi:hypothetical protein GCM10023165_49280 [Variovorax defluvii]|uniref:NADH:flavin oxidoreductase/NADH oxidase N-terminal domain-containing protein n=1 Tax=Variovorax defluvii TaxID=913761 RepID=A0ABP8IDH8_9BURK